MKKIISLLLILAVLISMIAACGTPKEQANATAATAIADATTATATANASTVEQSTAKPASEPVKIEFFQVKREIVDICNKFIADFQKENPNVTIEQNAVPDPGQVIQTRMASGDTPELFSEWPNASFTPMAKAGYVADLTGDPCLANIQDAVLKQTAIDGKNYCAPISFNTMGIFYNKKMFADNGLAAPKTYAELIDVSKKLKAKGIVPFTFQNQSVEAVLQAMENFFLQMPDFDQFIKDTLAGDIKISDPQRYSNLKKIGERILEVQSYGQPDSLGTGYDQGEIDFANGKSAMILMGSWIIGPVKKANPDLDFEMFTVPFDNADSTVAMAFPGDFALAVSSNAKYPEMDKKFIEFITRKENATYYAEKDGSPSCVKGVDVIVPQLSVQFEKLKAGKIGVPADAMWMSSVVEEMRKAMQKLIVDKDVDTWIKQMDKIFKDGYGNK